jgi:hypothetical protein
VIPKEKNDIYKFLLAATKLGHDFPRNSLPEYRDAMIQLKPAFSFKEAKPSLGWVTEEVATFSAVRSEGGKAKKVIVNKSSSNAPQMAMQSTSTSEQSRSGRGGRRKVKTQPLMQPTSSLGPSQPSATKGKGKADIQSTSSSSRGRKQQKRAKD